MSSMTATERGEGTPLHKKILYGLLIGAVLGLAAAAAVSLGVARVAVADVKLPAVFSGNAVLQRGEKGPLWGWADAGGEVTGGVGGGTGEDKGGEMERGRGGERGEN